MAARGKEEDKVRTAEEVLAEATQLFRAFPQYDIERYVGRRSEKWRGWAKRFLQFYQSLSPEFQEHVALGMVQFFAGQHAVGRKDVFVLESMWDFGHEGEYADALPDFFRRCMTILQSQLEGSLFERTVLLQLRSSTSIPRELRAEFDTREAVPSPEILSRQQQLEHDRLLERQILFEKGLPDDIDEMVYALQKMAKGKLGLPHTADFLARVIAKFQQNEQLAELLHVIEKLQRKQASWYATQQFNETR